MADQEYGYNDNDSIDSFELNEQQAQRLNDDEDQIEHSIGQSLKIFCRISRKLAVVKFDFFLNTPDETVAPFPLFPKKIFPRISANLL